MKLNFNGLIFFLFIAQLIQCCSNTEYHKKTKDPFPKQIHVDHVSVNNPKNNSYYTLHSETEFSLQAINNFTFDSVVISLQSEKIHIEGNNSNSIHAKVTLPAYNTGNITIRVVSYLNDTLVESDYLQLTALSDLEPEKLKYKTLNTFPHQINAYTQGLVYENGIIYEGTGSWGISRLLKYRPNEKPLKEMYIDQQLFGEGIEVYGDKLIQITYKARKGFVYDKNSFELLQEFKYPYQEGWGITFDGESLIMGDGSNKLYYLDKQLFTQIKQLEVCDNKGPVLRINELEFVNGKIYANVFGEDHIICIDPSTGKVLQRIDMSGLLKPGDRHESIDVLNGIAYNNDRESFFVTGKNWPKMFEVRFIKNN